MGIIPQVHYVGYRRTGPNMRKTILIRFGLRITSHWNKYAMVIWHGLSVYVSWIGKKNGKHREIGIVETTVTELLSRKSKRGNADREEAFELRGKAKNGRDMGTGLIVVIEATIEE